MLKPALLLLALGLGCANSICFLNETSAAQRKVVDRPKVLDEYHCKIICAERKECLSYVFYQRQCTINGEANTAVGAKPHQEWVKKTNDAVCPEIFKQPLLDEGYIPNPALARGATKVNNSKLNENLYACTDAALMDTLLPDNSHVVQGAMSWIEWDGRLGSWKFIKLMQRGMLGRPGKTYYIRAARCFEIDPTKFSATSSCAKLSDISIGNVPGREGPVQKYGQLNYCPHKFRFVPDFFDVTIVNGEVQYYDRPADKSFVTCIDGAWMLFDRTFGQLNRINFVAKFTNVLNRSMAPFEDRRLTLDGLPSDVIRSIIVIEQESIESLRLISSHWNTLALEHLSSSKYRPAIKSLCWRVASQYEATLNIRFSERYPNYFGLQKLIHFSLQNTDDVCFNLITHARNVKNFRDRVSIIMSRCSRIVKLELIWNRTNELEVVTKSMTRVVIDKLFITGIGSSNEEHSRLLDLLRANQVGRVTLFNCNAFKIYSGTFLSDASLLASSVELI